MKSPRFANYIYLITTDEEDEADGNNLNRLNEHCNSWEG